MLYMPRGFWAIDGVCSKPRFPGGWARNSRSKRCGPFRTAVPDRANCGATHPAEAGPVLKIGQSARRCSGMPGTTSRTPPPAAEIVPTVESPVRKATGRRTGMRRKSGRKKLRRRGICCYSTMSQLPLKRGKRHSLGSPAILYAGGVRNASPKVPSDEQHRTVPSVSPFLT